MWPESFLAPLACSALHFTCLEFSFFFLRRRSKNGLWNFRQFGSSRFIIFLFAHWSQPPPPHGSNSRSFHCSGWFIILAMRVQCPTLGNTHRKKNNGQFLKPQFHFGNKTRAFPTPSWSWMRILVTSFQSPNVPVFYTRKLRLWPHTLFCQSNQPFASCTAVLSTTYRSLTWLATEVGMVRNIPWPYSLSSKEPYNSWKKNPSSDNKFCMPVFHCVKQVQNKLDSLG